MDFSNFIFSPLTFFASISHRAYILYFFSYFAICTVIYLKNRSYQQHNLVDYLFPDSIYRSKTFLKDVIYFFFIAYVAILLNVAFSWLLSRVSALPPNRDILLNAFLYLLAFDLGMYVLHYAQHNIRFLWKFHAFHHQSFPLNILMAFRHHPVDLLFYSMFIALLTASIGQWLGTSLEHNIFLLLFYFAGYHLRHSHIPLEYPRWLAAILISPSDHQRHHHINAERQNYGFIFSIWDNMFKTKHTH